MRGIRILLAAAALACTAAAADAQTISYGQAGSLIAKSCGKDITKLCANTNLGGGELLDCMNANISKVSAQCQKDYATAIASIAKRVAAQTTIYKTCNADAYRLCQGMIPEDGNLLSCLLKASNAVSAPCNQAITDAGFR